MFTCDFDRGKTSLLANGEVWQMAENAKVRKNQGGYYIKFRYQGQQPYITCYKGEISFRDNLTLAQRSANVINSEIERGIFRPERWKKRSRKLYSVKGYSEHWLEYIQPTISSATYHDYKNSVQNHINPVLGEEYIEDLNLSKLNHLLNSIQRAPKGRKNVMGALKGMLKFAYQNGHIPAMPVFPEFRGTNQVVKSELRWVQPAEQFTILEQINRNHRPIFTFIMLTGCRPSEARAFRREDIKDDHINFAVTFGRVGELKEVKGKKIMPFPLTTALKQLFDDTPKNLTPFVFINPYTGSIYKRDTLNKIFRKAKAKAGINVRLNEWGRKSFAMQTLQVMDKSMVGYLLRHQDPRMIEHYAEYQTAPLKTILDKLHNFPSITPVKNTVNTVKSIT